MLSIRESYKREGMQEINLGHLYFLNLTRVLEKKDKKGLSLKTLSYKIFLLEHLSWLECECFFINSQTSIALLSWNFIENCLFKSACGRGSHRICRRTCRFFSKKVALRVAR